MRLLYISQSNARSGSNIALLNIIRGMLMRGHEVFVVTVSEPGFLVGELEKMGVKHCQTDMAMTVYPLNKNLLLYIPRIFVMLYRQYKGIKTIVKTIKSFKPDIVHTNVGPLATGYEACKRTGSPHIWHHRELMDQSGYHFFPSYASFIKKTSSEINHNICVTRTVFEHWNFNPDRDKVIYDGIFSEADLLQKECVRRKNMILYVGRIEETKGIWDLLFSFNLFHHRHPEFFLYVIGETPSDSIDFGEKCKKYVEEKSLQDCVFFSGRQENVYDYMFEATMLIMPSYSEGFGLVTAEAMACGCPVIARDAAGTKEQLDNGVQRTGYEIGIRFSNNAEMLAAMERVLVNDTSEMCWRAKDTVFNLYTIEKSIDEIEKYYASIPLSKRDPNTSP